MLLFNSHASVGGIAHGLDFLFSPKQNNTRVLNRGC